MTRPLDIILLRLACHSYIHCKSGACYGGDPASHSGSSMGYLSQDNELEKPTTELT